MVARGLEDYYVKDDEAVIDNAFITGVRDGRFTMAEVESGQIMYMYTERATGRDSFKDAETRGYR